MAITYSSPSYAGYLSKPFIADILLDAKTLKDGLITVMPNVKKRLVIQTIDTDAIVQARQDLFNPVSAGTPVNERELDPVNMMSQDQIGIAALLQSWQAADMKPGANNNDLPSDMGQFIIQRKAQRLAIECEKRIWLGDTSLTTDLSLKWHDGLIKKALADPTVKKSKAGASKQVVTAVSVGATTALTVAAVTDFVVGDYVTGLTFTGADAALLNGQSFPIIDVTGNVITISAVTTGKTITTGGATSVSYINQSNVVKVLFNAFRLIPVQIREADDFVFYVSRNIADAYVDASLNVAAGQGHAYQNAEGLVFKDKKIVPMDYFPTNTIFASRVGNLFFGTDLESDLNQVEAKYMKDVTLDDVYRYSAKFSGDVNFGFGSQISMFYPF